jgi:hypothetical protein
MEETGRYAADAAAFGNAGAAFGSVNAAPSSADSVTIGNASVPFGSPRPSGDRPGSSIPGGVGSRLESWPGHGLAGRLERRIQGWSRPAHVTNQDLGPAHIRPSAHLESEVATFRCLRWAGWSFPSAIAPPIRGARAGRARCLKQPEGEGNLLEITICDLRVGAIRSGGATDSSGGGDKRC